MPDSRDRLTTADAAAYCGFRSPRGLVSAYRRGKVYPVGRRGGSRSFTWRPEDLDAFLRGEEPMGGPLAVHDGSDVPTGHLEIKGRGLLRSDPCDGSAYGPTAPVRARLVG